MALESNTDTSYFGSPQTYDVESLVEFDCFQSLGTKALAASAISKDSSGSASLGQVSQLL